MSDPCRHVGEQRDEARMRWVCRCGATFADNDPVWRLDVSDPTAPGYRDEDMTTITWGRLRELEGRVVLARPSDPARTAFVAQVREEIAEKFKKGWIVGAQLIHAICLDRKDHAKHEGWPSTLRAISEALEAERQDA